MHILFAFFSARSWEGEDSNDVEKQISRQASKTRSVKEVLGNGLTPSTVDVAVYADLHSSVPGLGKAKTAMMLRSRFLGKLPKQGYCKKWITSVDCLMNVGEDTIGENIKPDDIRMWVEIAVYPYLCKLDVSYSSVKRKHGSQQLVYLQNACDLETGRSTHERLKKTMVHPLVTTTIASYIHPSSLGSCSHNEPDLKRELSRSYVGFSDGVADSVFEASTMEDPVTVAAEVELCGKGGGGAKS
ncbi:hypothetical protein DY000_02016232 [Brassica cretica]|uniref:Uncharacterized protein n=1 Tax=Brassica cretica TaxID=69181 RepID=A0ABQ7D0I8_BRACR|nr:hypothetical protein DY000_02016232 [Brassica cretica]